MIGHRTKAWFKHSLTIAWARFLVVSGAALEIAATAADILHASGFDGLVPPKWVGVYTVSLGLITEVARRRTEWQHHFIRTPKAGEGEE